MEVGELKLSRGVLGASLSLGTPDEALAGRNLEHRLSPEVAKPR